MLYKYFILVHFSDTSTRSSNTVHSTYLFSLPQMGFEPGIYDSLLLEFAVAHKPTQPPRPDHTHLPFFFNPKLSISQAQYKNQLSTTLVTCLKPVLFLSFFCLIFV